MAVVGAAAVGIGAGYGADLVLRPTSETTATQTKTATTTQLSTKTENATKTQTLTNTQTQTQTETQTQTVTETTTTQPPAPTETILTSVVDTGPYLAHVVNGRWTKSEPFLPNLPVGVNVFAARNRVYSPDRIRYPMKRVGWAPGGKSDNSNRGKGEFVRITWKEALDSAAAEIQRINTTYGPGAIYCKPAGHQWTGTLHVASWISSMLGAIGGYTSRAGGTSWVGWLDGSPLIWGKNYYVGNNYNDLMKNCQLIVIWGVDNIRTSIFLKNGMHNRGLIQMKKSGKIKFVVIDPRHSDTVALLADQWIPIVPGTDEAMAAAIAYVWITNNLINKGFISTHSVGFDEASLPAGAPANSSFQSYVMGLADGIPKTPQWAAAITGVDANTIISLATEWASKKTFLQPGMDYALGAAGPNRRENAGEFCRMMVALQTMLGYMGAPGVGIYSLPTMPSDTPVNMGRYGSIPRISNPVKQQIHHIQFGKAILNPPINWTSGVTALTYPMTGYSPVKMVYDVGGSAANQMEGPDNYHQAWQSQNLEFIASHHVWWEDMQMYCDIVMPTNHIGERDDIDTFQNYAIFSHKLIDPLYESMTDMEVVMGLAQRLGVSDKVFQGLTVDQWLQNLYASAKMPLSFDDFKAKGFIKFDTTPADFTTTSVGALQGFHDDPVKNPLATPTGKIEFYSTAIQKFYGPDGKTMPPNTAYAPNAFAPPVPMYVPATENKNSPLAQKYPLLHTGGGQKFGRHSQWNNMAWQRDDEQTFVNGYRVIVMNTQDATARGLKYGDVVRVFNDRGQILLAVKPTERMKPGVVWIFEGGHIKQKQPGVIGSLDMGGDHAYLCPTWQAEPICDGIITHSGLVQVEKYKG